MVAQINRPKQRREISDLAGVSYCRIEQKGGGEALGREKSGLTHQTYERNQAKGRSGYRQVKWETLRGNNVPAIAKLGDKKGERDVSQEESGNPTNYSHSLGGMKGEGEVERQRKDVTVVGLCLTTTRGGEGLSNVQGGGAREQEVGRNEKELKVGKKDCQIVLPHKRGPRMSQLRSEFPDAERCNSQKEKSEGPETEGRGGHRNGRGYSRTEVSKGQEKKARKKRAGGERALTDFLNTPIDQKNRGRKRNKSRSNREEKKRK